MPPNCLIVEDHPLLADALELAIDGALPHMQFFRAATFSEARAAVLVHRPIELAILDLCLPDICGFLGLLELRRLAPHALIVIHSAFIDEEAVQTAVVCGAAGYIPKTASRAALVRMLGEVMSGEIAIPGGYGLDPDRERLTLQQSRVLEMMSQGSLNKQIAFKLKICETTVKAHVGEVLRKLDVASRTRAVLKVVQTPACNTLDCNHVKIVVGQNGSVRSGDCSMLGDSNA